MKSNGAKLLNLVIRQVYAAFCGLYHYQHVFFYDTQRLVYPFSLVMVQGPPMSLIQLALDAYCIDFLSPRQTFSVRLVSNVQRLLPIDTHDTVDDSHKASSQGGDPKIWSLACLSW